MLHRVATSHDTKTDNTERWAVILLVEGFLGVGFEEVEDEEELAGGSVAEVLHDGPQDDLVRKCLGLGCGHVNQNRLRFDLSPTIIRYIHTQINRNFTTWSRILSLSPKLKASLRLLRFTCKRSRMTQEETHTKRRRGVTFCVNMERDTPSSIAMRSCLSALTSSNRAS